MNCMSQVPGVGPTRTLEVLGVVIATVALALSSCAFSPEPVEAGSSPISTSSPPVGSLLTPEATQGPSSVGVDERDTTEWRDVYVVGDSLTYKARRYFASALAEQGWRANPASESRIGRMVEEGLDVLRAEKELPETVLIALGTNNWLATRADAATWISEARAIVGPDRRLIWVNLHLEGERYVNFTEVNRGLRNGARSDNATLRKDGAAGRTYIADWYSFATTRGIPHSKDGVHYKQGASRQRMSFYAGVLADDPAYAPYLVK